MSYTPEGTVKVVVLKQPQSNVDAITVAEMYFESFTKASQFLHRLGLIFETWRSDDTLKFRNLADTKEYALLTQEVPNG